MVDIRVEQGDALARQTDVLVLKYAQGLHGLDRAAFDTMGGTGRSPLPRLGETLHISRPSGIAASNLLFVGVERLSELDYEGLRYFGSEAVSQAARTCPAAREICLTLHGTGVGLDETEAFDAEVAGVLEAIDRGEAGERLERVVIIERALVRARRLQALLPEQPAQPPRDGAVDPRRFSDAGLASTAKPKAFVAMPFAENWDDLFQMAIFEPLRDIGLTCGRMDKQIYTGDVVTMMCSRIQQADVVIAEVSDGNPNVFLEVGYAWALGKPTILLCHKERDSPFDIRNQAQLRYSGLLDLRKQLTGSVLELVPGTSRPD